MPEQITLPPNTVWHVTVIPGQQHFSTDGVETVLQAALKAGLDWPSSCRNGTCRTCLGRVIEGNVVYQIEWPGLSAEEKTEGDFLPCVACATSDLRIQMP